MPKAKSAAIEITPDEWKQIRRLVALIPDIIERYAHEAESSKAVLARMLAFEKRTKEALDEIIEEIERVNRLLVLEETGREQSGEAREIRSEIRQELTSVEWQIAKHLRNLEFLQMQAAGFGSLEVPLYLINEISDEQEIIQNLQTRRDRIKPS